jgi:hypothetical protein
MSAMVAGAGLAIIVGLIFGPLLLIWSLNTLFGLTIAYTLKTWFATMLLAGVFGPKINPMAFMGNVKK